MKIRKFHRIFMAFVGTYLESATLRQPDWPDFCGQVIQAQSK